MGLKVLTTTRLTATATAVMVTHLPKLAIACLLLDIRHTLLQLQEAMVGIPLLLLEDMVAMEGATVAATVATAMTMVARAMALTKEVGEEAIHCRLHLLEAMAVIQAMAVGAAKEVAARHTTKTSLW